MKGYASTQLGSKNEALMAKLLETMQTFAQQQSSGQLQLNTMLKTMRESLTFLKEAMSAISQTIPLTTQTKYPSLNYHKVMIYLPTGRKSLKQVGKPDK